MTGPAATFARETKAVESAEVVSAGEFLHVYRGQLADGDRVARLFVEAPEYTEDKPVRAAFDRAAEEWERLGQHPNVVTVYDRGTSPRQWLAVEDVDGERLSTAAPDLSLDDTRRVTADAAEALREADRTDCRHSALTPEHVWLCGERSEGATRVDWGIERACRVAAGESSASPYAAPEVRGDPPAATPRADVYSLGALAHYAAIGRPPSGPDDGSFDPETAIDPALPEALEAVLSTALAADPGDRHATPYEFKLAVLFDSHSDSAPGDVGTAGAEGSESDDAGDSGEPGPEQSETAPADTTSRRATLGAIGLAAAGGGLLLGTQLDRWGSSSPDDPVGSSADPDTGEPPEATFEFEYDRGDRSLTVVHAGGERIRAGRLTVRSDKLDATPVRWSDDTDYGPRSSVTAGETIAVDTDADPPFAVTAVWENSGRTAQLGSLRVLATTEIQVPEQVDRPPEGSFAIQYDSGVLRVSHERGESVPADRLFVRGRGFSGAPEYRWSDEPDVDSGVSIEPGDALERSADSDAVARLVWEREGERSVTMAEPEGVLSQGGPALGQTDPRIVLAQFRGPARPLDPGVGGASTGRYGGRNTGFGDGQSGPTSGVTEMWTRPAGPTDRSVSIAVGSLSPAPAVTGGIVYAGGNDGNLYALDAVDGAELWRVASGPFSSATVDDGTVYVGGTGIRAVAEIDGTELWHHGINGTVAGPPRVLDGLIYVSCGYPFNWKVRAISARDGSESWTVLTDGGPMKPPAIADRTVYVSGGDLRALAASSGAPRWRYETETLLTAPAIAGGTVYVGEIGSSGGAGFITALDAEDGTAEWRRRIDGPVTGSVAATDGRVYAAGSTGSGGFVTALSRQDGGVQWVREGEVPFRNPPIVAGGTLYVTDEKGRVHGLDAGDGSRQFLHATGDTLVGSPIAADGSLYLVGEEHSVYALGTPPESETVTRLSGE